VQKQTVIVTIAFTITIIVIAPSHERRHAGRDVDF